MAFCPVCQVNLRTRATLCPHVTVVVKPGSPVGGLYVRGRKRGVVDVAENDTLAVLTHIGQLTDGSDVYFSPSPKVYMEALRVAQESEKPVEQVYHAAWFRRGMEDHQWTR